MKKPKLEGKFEKVRKDYNIFTQQVNKHVDVISKHVKEIEKLCEKSGFPVDLKIFSMNENYTPNVKQESVLFKYGITDGSDLYDAGIDDLNYNGYIAGRWYNSNNDGY